MASSSRGSPNIGTSLPDGTVGFDTAYYMDPNFSQDYIGFSPIQGETSYGSFGSVNPDSGLVLDSTSVDDLSAWNIGTSGAWTNDMSASSSFPDPTVDMDCFSFPEQSPSSTAYAHAYSHSSVADASFAPVPGQSASPGYRRIWPQTAGFVSTMPSMSISETAHEGSQGETSFPDTQCVPNSRISPTGYTGVWYSPHTNRVGTSVAGPSCVPGGHDTGVPRRISFPVVASNVGPHMPGLRPAGFSQKAKALRGYQSCGNKDEPRDVSRMAPGLPRDTRNTSYVTADKRFSPIWPIKESMADADIDHMSQNIGTLPATWPASQDEADGRFRNHIFYQAQAQADGLYHCPFAKESDGCRHKPTNLKCNYECVAKEM